MCVSLSILCNLCIISLAFLLFLSLSLPSKTLNWPPAKFERNKRAEWQPVVNSLSLLLDTCCVLHVEIEIRMMDVNISFGLSMDKMVEAEKTY